MAFDYIEEDNLSKAIIFSVLTCRKTTINQSMINFRTDKWIESMLSITDSQKWSFILSVISIIKLNSLSIQYAQE